MSLTDKTIVVTGGKGFLGGFVCRAIEEKCGKAIAIGSKDYNLIEQSDVRRMYSEQKPDIVIHLAAACGGIGGVPRHLGTTRTSKR